MWGTHNDWFTKVILKQKLQGKKITPNSGEIYHGNIVGWY